MIRGSARRPGGYAHWFNGQGPDLEKDSVTCCHCNRVVFLDPLRPVEEFTAWCMRCMKFTCLACADRECVPFEKKLEEIERARR